MKLKRALILEIRGGLGNQMFQYSLYRKLCMDREIKCYIACNKERPYKLDIFPKIKIECVEENIYNQIIERYKNRSFLKKLYQKIFGKKEIFFENLDKKLDNDVYKRKYGIISGYFQREEYFIEIKSLLLEEFTFPSPEYKLNDFIQRLSENSVSVHIRRGDYLALANVYGGICTNKYYEKAFSIIENQVKDPEYIVLSDDIEYAKEIFAEKNVTFVYENLFDRYEDWYDMYIMSMCHHNITANSSFSWWGAWLNAHKDKIVIAPKRYDNVNRDSDIACREWIKI